MRIRARGFVPDILMNILEFGSRRGLARLQLVSYIFYILVEKYFPQKPYHAILSLFQAIYPLVCLILEPFYIIVYRRTVLI